MTTPHVTETVPDSIRSREPVTIAHLIQRERVRASLMGVPYERRADELEHDSHRSQRPA